MIHPLYFILIPLALWAAAVLLAMLYCARRQDRGFDVEN